MQTERTLDRESLAHLKFLAAMDAIAAGDTPAYLKHSRIRYSAAGATPWMTEILQETATHFGFKSADLISRDRSAPVARARHVAMFLCRKITGRSIEVISGAFQRDHSTVCAAIKKTERLRAADPATAQQISAIAGLFGRKIER